ncbi:hypothetical protein JCM21900_004839 [Sporobolomyces salmonicolor]
MAKRRSSALKAEEDSLEVHPATQTASAEEESASVVETPAPDEQSLPGGQDSEGYWEAIEIIGETANKYWIVWAGTNPDTGEPWKPTWEPKENATVALVSTWKAHGKRKHKEDKARRKAEKAARKVAKAKLSRGNNRRAQSRSSDSALELHALSVSASPSRSSSVEIEEPAPRSIKRKMVVPDSNISSQPQSPKKQMAEERPAVNAFMKKVAFALPIDDSDAEYPAIEEPTVAASLGETSLALVPDSQPGLAASWESFARHGDTQVVVDETFVASQGTGTAGPAQPRLFGGLTSPATSHSDLGADPDHGDDVAIFNRLDHDDLSPHLLGGRYTRPLGPVPVPPVSAFELHGDFHIASSQLDPIEDPDSSPRRSPFDRRQPTHGHSPRLAARPAKVRLELVTHDGTPASSFEAELQSSAAASYVSASFGVGQDVIRRLPFVGPFATHRLTGSTLVKRPHFRPPTPPAEFDMSAGLGAAAVARADVPRMHSPPVGLDDDELVQALGEGGESDLGGFAQEFFDEIFDYDQRSLPSEASAATKTSRPDKVHDAGESGHAPNDMGPSSNGQQPSANGYSYQQAMHSPIPGFIASGPSAVAGTGFSGAPGYGYGSSAPGGHGHHFPPHLPPSHASAPSRQQPYKRELEGETDDLSVKKPRTDQAPQRLPTSHVPAPPSPQPFPSPAQQSLRPIAPHPQAVSPIPQAHASPALQHLPPLNVPANTAAAPSPRPPALAIVSPSPGSSAQVPSPSLARVQSMERFVIPNPALQPGQTRSSVPPGQQRSPSPSVQPSPSLRPTTPGSVSRNGSPAPGATKVDDLVALVKASQHIVDTDGTKEEIEKFLRDPKTYVEVGNGPLSRAEFWAFELRRQTIDGVEKIDFIIIHSREGKFQLKRAAADKVPVDFARSLTHAPARIRGLTPAVEAVPTIHASSPGVGPTPLRPAAPVPPAAMTREQLEQEVDRLRHRVAAAESELAAVRPAAAEAAKLKVDVQTLTKTNRSLQNSRDSAQSDLQYVQAQYQEASTAAVVRAQEASVAEAEAERLRGLLDVGLRQKEALHRAEVRQLKLEVEMGKKEMAFYKEESRRTQEQKVREKAAQWDECVAKMRIRQEAEAKRARGEAVEDDSDEDDTPLDDEKPSPVVVDQHVTLHQGHGRVTLTQETTRTTTSATGSAEPSTMKSTGSQEEHYQCEWRGDSGTDAQAQPPPCEVVVPSRAALLEHAMSHVA